jgi:cytochrome c peroxidase
MSTSHLSLLRKAVAFPGSLLFVVTICFFLAEPPGAQTPMAGGAAGEPITPIPSAPNQDRRQVELGDRLFHDRRLSHDNTRSCSSCHDTTTNGASSSRQDLTPDGRPIFFNTPTVFNAALSFRLNWEGNYRTLESEAEQSVRRPEIMASSVEEALSKLSTDPDMARRFREAFGREMDGAALTSAISAYERSLLTPGGRFDLWLGGDAKAITSQEITGYQLFKSLGCVSCHQGVNVGGNMFQRHGVFHPLASPKPEVLRVPSLRNVAVTPPYFHDGSAATLPEAVKKMGYAQLDRVLTEDETTAIVAFLNTLTGTYLGKPLTPGSGALQKDPPQ